MHTGIRWRSGLLILCLMGLAWKALCQDPSYRPRLMWHVAASYLQIPAAFTEDGAYLLTQSAGNYLVMVHRTADILEPNSPKGHSLVSYDYEAMTYVSFTDRDESGNEYVVGGVNGAIRMWRWVRDPLAFRGGYLESPKQWTISGWAVTHSIQSNSLSVMLVLRGDRVDRRYNRLAVSGDANGNLRIVLLNYNATSQSPVVVSNAHAGAITAIAYDPATRRLITGGRDGLIRIWQVGIDSTGVPSLAHFQTIPAHWSNVTGLALATVDGTRYLVSASDDLTIAGWSWPNPSSSPIWQIPVQGSLDDVTFPRVYGITPYGDLSWIVLAHPVNALPHALLITSLIDPSTGKTHYSYLYGDYRNWSYQPVSPFLASPSIGGNRYWVGVALSVLERGAVGVVPYTLDYVSQVASASASCTALDTLSVGTTRYLAAGYADGELRVYRNTGSGWTLWDSSQGLHSNKRVIGVRLITHAGQVFTLSVDVEGGMVIARHTGSVTSELTRVSGLASAASMALGSDATSALVAVGGQQSGTPRIEVFRLTWSGTTPNLVLLAGFAVTGETGFAVDLDFVQVGSADVVVSTGSRVSRWNFVNNAYTRALNIGTSSDPGFQLVDVEAGRVWRLYHASPVVNDVNSGGLLWTAGVSQFGEGAAGDILVLDAQQAVWGVSLQGSSQDGFYWLARGRALLGGATQSQAYNSMQRGLLAHLPEAVTCIVRDPSQADRFYVGCLDGSIQQVYLPDWTPKQMAYVGLSGTLFEIVQNRMAIFLTSWHDAFTLYSGSFFGIRHAAILDVTTGQIIARSMLCNADGTTGCTPADTGISSLVRLSPSGNVMYGYEWGNDRLSGWNGTTMAPLFNTTSFLDHWWPIGLDDSRVALLYNEARGSYTVGSTTYYRYRPVIRVIKWTPTLTTEATRPLEENTEMRFIMSDPNLHLNHLMAMRWDMNTDRRVGAIYGRFHYDTNNPSLTRHRVLLLHRPSPTDWGNWVLRDILEQNGDFPPGVYPTMLRFHPNAPGVLYVGLSNGRLRIYRVDANGNLTNRSNPQELVPTLGTLGAVSVMDVGNYVWNGLNYSTIVFGGPEGLSVWAGFVCQPNWLQEVHFYKTDVAFFPSAGMGYLRISQPTPSLPPYMVYSNGLAVSAAKLEGLPELPCPEDVNRDNAVNDADLLDILFAFGGGGYIPPDVNCDGRVDDADLLQVLFAFGRQC